MAHTLTATTTIMTAEAHQTGATAGETVVEAATDPAPKQPLLPAS